MLSVKGCAASSAVLTRDRHKTLKFFFSSFFYVLLSFYLAFALYNNDGHRGGRPAVFSRKRFVTVPQNNHLQEEKTLIRVNSNAVVLICITARNASK